VQPYGNDPRCIVAMAVLNLSTPEWILGDPLIREYCTAYDLIGKQIGLFKAAMWSDFCF
jgi:hypothetical protein